MTERKVKKERQTSTVKVTADILEAISRATEYYGNVSALAKMMGVAHSTIIFWRSGKTTSMSGRLWVTRIRPVLEPFLPSSKIKISDINGQYTPQFPVMPPYMEVKKVERHEVNVMPASMLKGFDPALETAPVYVRSCCTEKRTFYHTCRKTAFALKNDDHFIDVFPENCYLLAYPDGLQNGCQVLCKLQGGTEILARKYTKDGSMICLSVLPGGSGEDIVWDCSKEIGRLAWCFPLVELNLDLLPKRGMNAFNIEEEFDEDDTSDDGDSNSGKKRRGKRRKNVND